MSARDVFFSPVFNTPLIWGVGAALGVLTVVAYVRAKTISVAAKISLAALRMVLIGLLMLLLLRPMQLHQAADPAEKPRVVVLVDTSCSMNTKDEGDRSRIGAVADALAKSEQTFRERLDAKYQVEYFEFGDETLRKDVFDLARREEAAGLRTDLAAALNVAVGQRNDRPVAAALVISDGRQIGGGDVTEMATLLKSRKIPVWTAPVGSAAEVKDLFVTATLNQNFLFVKQAGSVKVELAQSGYKNWYGKVSLYREGQYVASQQALLKESSTHFEFPIKEENKGVFKYTVTVDPLTGEADTSNNRRSIFVRVTSEKPKVLLVEAQPYWDTRFLLRALQADPNLEVSSLFQLNAKKNFAIQERTSAETLEKERVQTALVLPRTKEELYKYDCLILGRGIDQALSAEQLKMLRDYLLERGGGIVFARGKSYSGDNKDLAAIEPVLWQDDFLRDVRFELTSEGKLNPIFSFSGAQPADLVIRELPSLVSVTKVAQEKSLAVVLAKTQGEAKQLAAIAYQRYGRGKVMTVGTTGLWRWSFMPEDLKQHDAVYALFWRQMIRWLIDESDFLPGQQVSFRSDRYTYFSGEKIRLVARTKEIDAKAYQPRIEIVTPNGKKTLIPTAEGAEGDREKVYIATFTPEVDGEFEATLFSNVGQPKEEKARFTVYSDSLEKRFVSADHDLLGQVSRITGGEQLKLSALGEFPERLRQFELLAKEKGQPVDVWDRLSIFSLIVLVLCIEWFVRRRLGLV